MAAKVDITIWGATGYTGRLTCEYLAQNNKEEVRWAIAGRNASKLEALVATLRMKYSVEVPYVVANLEDEGSIHKMCEQTRVLIALAGPYTLSGEPIVAACIAADTHYVDITAELPWSLAMGKKYDLEASKRKLKMITSCGFDFVPNDIMMLQLQRYLSDPNIRAVYQPFPREVIHAFEQSTPFVSGGTAHSGLQMVRSKGLRNIVPYYVNPYAMCPNEEPDAKTTSLAAGMNRYQLFPARVSDKGYYCVPFVMSSLMSKYIHWSNQLQDHAWGRNLVYRGGEKHRYTAVAYLYSFIIWVQFFLLICLAHLPFTWKWLPTQGEGPAIDPQTAFMESDMVAHVAAVPSHEGGNPLVEKVVNVNWRLDGGEAYQAAAIFVSEAAKMLSVEPNECTTRFGWLSPSAALGMRYLERLERTSIKMTVNDITEKMNV